MERGTERPSHRRNEDGKLFSEYRYQRRGGPEHKLWDDVPAGNDPTLPRLRGVPSPPSRIGQECRVYGWACGSSRNLIRLKALGLGNVTSRLPDCWLSAQSKQVAIINETHYGVTIGIAGL